jgi:hypothetical protein
MNSPHDDLARALKDYYGSVQLPAATHRRLKDMILAEARTVEDKTKFFLRFSFASPLGRLAFTGLAVALLLLSFSGLRYHLTQQWHADIAAEIAYNHAKQLEPEFRTNSYEKLAAQMPRLDFRVIKPDKLDDEMQLVGGRYCSVDKQIAAQLRVLDRTGAPCTLYEFHLPERWLVTFPADKEVETNGLTVRLWQEKGVMLGLAYSGAEMP